ncbi:MAG: zinc ribbon domain-containing protein [Verrucomicrobiota bacterium]|jgi:putative FmdB family regulatory protein
MPTYEYVCSKCEHHFEKIQRITDKPLKICPKELCHLNPWGKGKVTRAISTGGGLIFKGSGFYSTDYRSDNYKAGAKKEAASASGASSEGAKKETKTSDTAAPKTPAPAPAPSTGPSSPKSG